MQAEHRTDNDAAGFLQQAVTVGKVHLLPCQPVQISMHIHDFHAFADIADLTAIGTGIHVYTAADGSRNAMGKLHAGQALIRRKNSRPGHGHTGHHADAAVTKNLHAVHGILQADAQSLHAGIRCQHIGARAQNHRSSLQSGSRAKQCGKLRRILRKCHCLHRPTDAK